MRRSASKITSGDVFILDLGKKIYQLNGSECNKDERFKVEVYSIMLQISTAELSLELVLTFMLQWYKHSAQYTRLNAVMWVWLPVEKTTDLKVWQFTTGEADIHSTVVNVMTELIKSSDNSQGY